ncbi:MAG: excinuclease ABC subunit UvrA [Gammaproteobacteria bacterium]|nr:excinuclease ABC subunit UvrA [Gammaproteobacteria bacterium]MYC61038.1 excinuclease ABC subunit UvrA [Gammaproteobacteria bacterium]MYG95926.1 excinuclease ABC subunit UvrA [Gammaproteobacteria bacterium]
MDSIFVKGARTHNLKNIDLTIPRDKLVVITGLSGSGKSSLAFDTLYAEGQRRYVESLSTYARQFLSMMEKPDVDHIDGLSPAISIEQKSTSHNPRSTVGTITEIYDYLRLLFARAGEPFCPEHQVKLEAQTVSQMVDQVLALPEGTRVMLLAPVVRDRKGEHIHVFNELRTGGFIRARVDGLICEIDYPPELDKNKKHSIEVVVDRLRVRPDQAQRLAESFETALHLSEGLAMVANMDAEQDSEDMVFSALFACPHCGHSIRELEPRLFSFNNPAGACSSCDGLGVREFFDESRVVTDPERSLSEGAIRGWEPRNLWYYSKLEALARHYGFDLTTPFQRLDRRCQDIILHGSGDEVISFRYVGSSGMSFSRRKPFEGVMPHIMRRYNETDSDRVRAELARYLSFRVCPDCDGTRLKQDARNVFIEGHNLPEISEMTVARAARYFNELELEGKQARIAEKVLKELQQRLKFLVDVGLNYLTLNRSAETLSGGEAQRIRLASQIGAGLVGVMYILDEPSIGLHQRDNGRLLNTLLQLRDLGNTVLVVEHDEEAIRSADHIIDIGPGAGIHGGEIVAQGHVNVIENCVESITGKFLSGQEIIGVPERRTRYDKERLLLIKGARGNNLQQIDVTLPLGLFTCVTGVSGSGKSTLVNHTLYPIAATRLNKAQSLSPAPYDAIEGLQLLDKVVDIDQSPIGRTPRSNPATYTGLFTPVRDLFAATAEARSRGYKPGRFSFNVKGGRCEACQGDGLIKVEMHFLPDVYVTCDLCQGKRYNRETLEVKFKGKDIHQVLDMTVEEAREFFDAIPVIANKLQTLIDVGLSYIRLGQSATTLSGGEAQRVKLSRELSKRDTGSTLYILDEPTTGLHFHDIRQLLKVLHRLRDHGNSIVVVEHNLDVIKTADWIIDLGPEGGSGGGRIVTSGTPEQVAEVPASHTGRFLQKVLPWSEARAAV